MSFPYHGYPMDSEDLEQDVSRQPESALQVHLDATTQEMSALNDPIMNPPNMYTRGVMFGPRDASPNIGAPRPYILPNPNHVGGSAMPYLPDFQAAASRLYHANPTNGPYEIGPQPIIPNGSYEVQAVQPPPLAMGGSDGRPDPSPSASRRMRRIIRNRESAARSRARREAYTNQLEMEVQKLKEANSKLKLSLRNLENGINQPSSSSPDKDRRPSASSNF